MKKTNSHQADVNAKPASDELHSLLIGATYRRIEEWIEADPRGTFRLLAGAAAESLDDATLKALSIRMYLFVLGGMSNDSEIVAAYKQASASERKGRLTKD